MDRRVIDIGMDGVVHDAFLEIGQPQCMGTSSVSAYRGRSCRRLR